MPQDVLPLRVRDLGLMEYQRVWQAMATFTNERGAENPDEVWMVEHPAVFTQGQAGKAEHVLMPGDIPVVQVDRGGQVTYHGPGQLVVYPLLNIRRLGMGVRDLVNKLEQAIVDTLAEFDVTAYPKPDAPGVYVDGNKVASLGLRIRKGCSFHGLAINVDMDLEPFQRINPCGYAGLEMVQLKDLSAKKIDMTELKTLLMGHLQGLLGQETLEYPEGLPALLKSGL